MFVCFHIQYLSFIWSYYHRKVSVEFNILFDVILDNLLEMLVNLVCLFVYVGGREDGCCVLTMHTLKVIIAYKPSVLCPEFTIFTFVAARMLGLIYLLFQMKVLWNLLQAPEECDCPNLILDVVLIHIRVHILPQW